MAQDTQIPKAAAPREVFSLVVPAELRMAVEAQSQEEAGELLRAMCGSGGWVKAMLDLGWSPPRTGVEVSVRIS